MGKRLYYGQPINWGNPLNRGLVSRWQVVPWYASGPRLIDLAGRNHGTLTNGPTWQGANGRQGGFGSLKFDGTDDEVTVTDTSLPSGTTPRTFSAWIYPTADPSAENTRVSGWWGTNNTIQGMGWGYVLSLGTYYLRQFSWADANVNYDLGGSIANTRWRHFAGTWDGTNGNIYLDGLLVGGPTAQSQNTVLSGTMRIGREPSGFTQTWQGYQDNVCIHNRALSASEVYALYIDSLQGSPQTLNWLSTRTYFGVTAAPPPVSGVCHLVTDKGWVF